MSDGTYTRRTLLRRSVATMSAGTVVGTAGCLDRIPNPLGGGSYTAWLPAPDALDVDVYSFGRYDNDDWTETEDEFSDDYDESGIEDQWEPIGVSLDDVSESLYFHSIQVHVADFDRQDLVEDLEDENYDEEAEIEGYTLFLADGERRAFALNGSAFICTASYYDYEQSPEDALTAVIEAKAGTEDRYVDESDAMSKLIDTLGTNSSVTGETVEDDEDDPANGRFDEMVAQGATASLDGETTEREWAVVYESGDDVDLDDLEEWVDENDDEYGQFEDVDDIEYNQSGRVGRITGTMDTDNYV